MIEFKSLLESRTLWANGIGLAALGLSALGFDTSAVNGPAVADSALQAVAGLSFVASTLFRVLATKRLGRPG